MSSFSSPEREKRIGANAPHSVVRGWWNLHQDSSSVLVEDDARKCSPSCSWQPSAVMAERPPSAQGLEQELGLVSAIPGRFARPCVLPSQPAGADFNDHFK